ncbi:retrotransposon protein, putative, ty1-copia subclass [Tanacetum coccineum]
MKVWKRCLEATAKIGRQGGDLFCLVLKGGDGGACKLLREMALPVQNINHSAFRSMFEREKLSAFTLFPGLCADSRAQVLAQWNAVYDAYNEVYLLGCLSIILSVWNPELHRQFESSSPYDMIRELKSMPRVMEKAREVGHWKRNCHVYLAELIMKKKQVYTASPLGARKLKEGALYLYMGNGVRAQVEAIGISKNDVLYFNAISSNGIYEIDMINRVPNVNSIYTVSNKRAKPSNHTNLITTQHHHLTLLSCGLCVLTHISKKRIEKLQHEGLLKSTEEESFDKCVSCLSSKMTRKSQGASYFITFTDDYSRYGYVYLLKHKNEVFETFKVFKNEVENQLEKTIKALRSYRGGEYISQEFKDYLKACGIVQELTPPYTPQRNRVSEKRNRTLLDMV